MEKLAMWVAYRLPRSVVYWAAVRLGVYATTGEHSSTVVPDLTLAEALKRWRVA